MRKSVSPNRKNLKDTHADGGEESGPSAIKNRVNALDVSPDLFKTFSVTPKAH